MDHGNLLGMIILLSKYDPLLKRHLDKVIKRSKHAHISARKGRGSLLTFISKTMVNHLLEVIALLIKRRIANELSEAGMIYVHLDTTQDISVKDQCSIIVRYVNKDVGERLLAVVHCTDSTEKGFFELLSNVLIENGLDISCCICNATDGAANMQGVYNGFSAWLNNESPGQNPCLVLQSQTQPCDK